jgi:hypothetical protein
VDEATVTVHVLVNWPSFVVTVIVVVPAFTAVTRPLPSTVATVGSDDVHLTLLSIALAGDTVAVICEVPPMLRDTLLLLSVTPVTATLDTVTEHVAVYRPSFVVTVIVVVPAFSADTEPLLLTVATDGSDDAHVTLLSVALDGSTVAVIDEVPPTVSDKLVLLSVTPVTDMFDTDTEEVAVCRPSLVVTVIVAVPAFTAVTNPLLLTVATDESEDVHDTPLFVAVLGVTVQFNLIVAGVKLLPTGLVIV